MLIGNDAESVATRIAELLAIISARQQAARDAGPREARFRPDIVVIFDGSRKLRALPGAVQLLQEGPPVGVYAICLDADEQLLPAECQAVVVVEGRPGPRAAGDGGDAAPRSGRTACRPDWCARLARSIAPIRDVSDADDGVRAAGVGPAAGRAGAGAAGRRRRSPVAGGTAAGPRWPSSASRTTGRSASTSARTGRTR